VSVLTASEGGIIFVLLDTHTLPRGCTLVFVFTVLSFRPALSTSVSSSATSLCLLCSTCACFRVVLSTRAALLRDGHECQTESRRNQLGTTQATNSRQQTDGGCEGTFSSLAISFSSLRD